jgi:hypothetical protein
MAPQTRDPHFDAYLMVDWSANNSPKRGKDSIWYCFLERIAGTTQITTLENPPTRHLAYAQIHALLLDLAHRRRHTLVGFDFPYGYPRGFAQALKINSPSPWQAAWNLLSSRILDDENNRSNRFEAAAELNAALSAQPFPFWGCPANKQQKYLSSKHRIRHQPGMLPEFRFTERHNGTGSPQPAWKLSYPGSVGSQALLGIPHVHRLRFYPTLSAISQVWPFETGFQLTPRTHRAWQILQAEIYPSINTWPPDPTECKDQAQVRGLAHYFAQQDETGHLATLFAPPTGFSAAELHHITTEEGWILGVL